MVSKFRPSPIGRVLGAGGCEIMYAIRSYANDSGDHRCDVFSPEGGVLHFNCPVLNGSTNRIGAPATPWNGEDLNDGDYPLVVALTRSGGRGPVILGQIDNPRIYYTPTATGPGTAPPPPTPPPAPPSTQASGNPTSVTVNDVIIQNDNTKIVIRDETAGNDAVIVSARNIELIADSGRVMVPKGTDASDGPVLATPFKERDDTIIAYCAAMTEWANSLYQWASQLFLVTGPAGPTAAVPVSTIVSSPPEPPTELDPTTVRSAVLRLASDVEAGA